MIHSAPSTMLFPRPHGKDHLYHIVWVGTTMKFQSPIPPQHSKGKAIGESESKSSFGWIQILPRLIKLMWGMPHIEQSFCDCPFKNCTAPSYFRESYFKEPRSYHLYFHFSNIPPLAKPSKADAPVGATSIATTSAAPGANCHACWPRHRSGGKSWATGKTHQIGKLIGDVIESNPESSKTFSFSECLFLMPLSSQKSRLPDFVWIISWYRRNRWSTCYKGNDLLKKLGHPQFNLYMNTGTIQPHHMNPTDLVRGLEPKAFL